ncbi:Trichothecene 15-O-acetyltransferase [Penicillium ucsense]|uniref:Trichothecene 15-O-acetyltransferase n=1 Tax=Penicillium ucsense TaxID=2839758 RepID=A0A8J8VW33_9EURO|nr:Trichothecene 15-O-acetyltransferase [Penicillium ucsense]KAF7729786.1 Trichothecene 15-O-acetyltransferase [Penicillium ucsense]
MPLSTDDDNRFAWRATGPGRWERDIDEVEEFYTSLAKAHNSTGRTFFAITGFVSLSVPIQPGVGLDTTEKQVEDALRVAWIRLRFHHPTIASRVQYDHTQQRYRKLYETCIDDASQQEWLADTFRVVPGRMSGLDCCNEDPPVPTLPTLFLIRSPVSDDQRRCWDLVLRAHHDIIDGMGTLLLFHNLLRLAAEAYEQSNYAPPQFGQEWTTLSPPLRTAAAIPAVISPSLEERLREILKQNALLKEGVEIASVPFQRDVALPGKHQRAAVTLSQDTTARPLEDCRALGLSITHAYHAAIALAVGDLAERTESPRTVRYISYCLINERQHCLTPYNTPSHAVSVYHSVSGQCLSIDLDIPALSDQGNSQAHQNEFIPIAQKVRSYYCDIRADKDHINLVPAYWAMSTSAPGPDPSVAPARNETPSASISSMGVLDNIMQHRYGSFVVEHPWVTGEELGTRLGLFLDTWKGKLTLSAAYNDAWHTRQEVVDFLSACNEIVFQGLRM